MKRNKVAEIKNLEFGGLIAKQKAIKAEIASLLLDKNTKKLKDVKSIYQKKKDLAQVLTILRQKELFEQLKSQAKKEENGR